jgi:hypothetical protein
MIITPFTNTLSETTHSHMRYLFQNVHKSRKTVHDLLDSRQNAIDILFIQEAPINFIRKVPSASNPEGDDLKGPVHHKAWQCIDRRLTFDDSAVAIYLNKRIMTTHQAIVNDSPMIHKDVLVVQVTSNKLKNMDFTLVNVYNRPGAGNKAVLSLLQVAPTIANIAVIQGDFNLHSPLWDERTHHQRLGPRHRTLQHPVGLLTQSCQ